MTSTDTARWRHIEIVLDRSASMRSIYTGSQNLLYRYINQGRVECDRPAISPKRLAGLLLSAPGKVTGHHAERLDAAIAACHEMTMLAGLVRDFAALLDPQQGNDQLLTAWIEQACQVDLPHLHAFTRGLEYDRAAVNAALTLPFHNGGTEGVNTKTKRSRGRCTGEPASRSSATASCSPNHGRSPPKVGQSQ